MERRNALRLLRPTALLTISYVMVAWVNKPQDYEGAR